MTNHIIRRTAACLIDAVIVLFMKKPLIVLLFAAVAQSVHGTPSPYQPPLAPATKSAYLT